LYKLFYFKSFTHLNSWFRIYH